MAKRTTRGDVRSTDKAFEVYSEIMEHLDEALDAMEDSDATRMSKAQIGDIAIYINTYLKAALSRLRGYS